MTSHRRVTGRPFCLFQNRPIQSLHCLLSQVEIVHCFLFVLGKKLAFFLFSMGSSQDGYVRKMPGYMHSVDSFTPNKEESTVWLVYMKHLNFNQAIFLMIFVSVNTAVALTSRLHH